MKTIKYGSVCSGIEAATCAWHPLGWQAEWFAEIEPFPSAVLAHHYPNTPNLGDMTKLAAQVLASRIPAPDILVGGTPCQAFSVAGMREGLADPRGALTIKYVELADATDLIRTRRGEPEAVIVWENVPGVLSDKGNAFGCFLGALAGEDCELQPAGKRWADAGCVYGPKRTIAWRVLDAQYFGLAQRRRRVFVVASARAGFDPVAVLFEREGVRRDTAPRRGEGQDTAAGTLRSTNGGSDVDHACAQHLTAHTITANYGKDGGMRAGNDCVPVNLVVGTLQANGKAAGSATQQDAESGLLVVHGTQDPCVSDKAFALGRNSGQENAVCQFGDVAGTLTARHDSSPCADRGMTVVSSMRSAVRRLTPAECEKLQGFPLGYTLIPWRGKPEDECPDGPRYKAIGNSKAVPVVRWIGRRIQLQM